jgi:hypothetical protein
MNRQGCRSIMSRLGPGSPAARYGVVAAAVVALSLLFATASALASFEPISPPFASGNGHPLIGVAVDYNSGDVYVVDRSKITIGEYSAKGNFLRSWGAVDGTDPEGIAVDQTTGDVYVTNGEVGTNANVVEEFSPEGSLITTFGKEGSSSEPVSESPERIHEVIRGDIAVSPTGIVYIGEARRVMVFEPESPGDVEHYVYAGQSHDAALTTEDWHVAFDDSSGDLYVANSTNDVYVFDAGDFASPACEYNFGPGGIESLSVDPDTGEAFFGTYKGGATIYRIDVCAEAGKQVVEALKGLPAGGDEVYGLAFNPEVSFEADRPAGLLYETNELAVIFSQPPVVPPGVVSESVSDVGVASAVLSAQVDPEGYETRYSFQYGTAGPCSTSSCVEVPVGGGVLGSGTGALTASSTVGGLEPGMTYYYRVLASSHCSPGEPARECDTAGPDRVFHTFPAGLPRLPDGRVFELVSPPSKGDGDVFPNDPGIEEPGGTEAGMLRVSAVDGDGLVYEGGAFSAVGEASKNDEYLSVRTASGWQTRDLSPALSTGTGELYVAFSPDLSAGLFFQEGGLEGEPSLSGEAPAGYSNLYSRQTADGAFSPVLSSVPAGGDSAGGLRFAGASAALSNIVFTSSDALTAETAFAPAAQSNGSDPNLYESVDGALRLANVLPGNAASEAGAVLGAGGNVVTGAVSSDGERVYWTDLQTGRLYVRVNGESTIEVPDTAGFLAASADGSKVLLDDGYMYELNEREGSFEGVADLDEGGGATGFQGILGSSDDLSTVYFVDTSVLPGAQANSEGGLPVAGANNLYVWREAGEGREASTTFVATLGPNDNRESITSVDSRRDWQASPSNRSAQASPDGRYLAFTSEADLTGYGAYIEDFIYDSVSGRLTCVSCSPTGENPVGGATLSLVYGDSREATPQPAYISDDGRLFFETSEQLSPYDTSGLEELYEYEPDGLGSCVSVDGCVFLVSGGDGDYGSRFLAADPSGENVFFTTRDQLVPEDQDELIDVYDARVNGGFPATAEPECTGAGCQGIPDAPPVFATPSSVTFNGVGNFPSSTAKPPVKSKAKKRAVRCPRGKQPSHGKCSKAKGKSGGHAKKAARKNIRGKRRGS